MALGDLFLKLLSLDTSTPRGSIALLNGEELAAELRLLSPAGHSSRLLENIRYLLGCAGWKLGDLHLIVACIGPGSFTGIRIGVATALGLAQTLGIPFAGVSGLDALARQLPGHDGRIGAAMDAQRGQVFYAEYRSENGRIRLQAKPALLYPRDLAGRAGKGRVTLIGDGAQRYAREWNRGAGQRRLHFVEVDLFLAAALGRIALKRKQSWRSGEFLHTEPLYIRPPDAMRRKASRP